MPSFPIRLGKIGKTNVGWAVVTFLGIYSFVWAKNQVDKQRKEILLSKRRMLESNSVDYDYTKTSTRNFGTSAAVPVSSSAKS